MLVGRTGWVLGAWRLMFGGITVRETGHRSTTTTPHPKPHPNAQHHLESTSVFVFHVFDFLKNNIATPRTTLSGSEMVGQNLFCIVEFTSLHTTETSFFQNISTPQAKLSGTEMVI
jgi:hypothetical protein